MSMTARYGAKSTKLSRWTITISVQWEAEGLKRRIAYNQGRLIAPCPGHRIYYLDSLHHLHNARAPALRYVYPYNGRLLITCNIKMRHSPYLQIVRPTHQPFTIITESLQVQLCTPSTTSDLLRHQANLNQSSAERRSCTLLED